MRTKVIIGLFWAALVVGLAVAIRFADEPPAPTTAIATLVDTKNGTLYRPADFLLWHPAATGQGLGDGDYVATGKGGGATLRFDDGRTVRLGPDTILIVTRRNMDGEALYTLNLVQGRVVNAKPAAPRADKAPVAKPTKPILITAGERVIELTPKATSFAVARKEQSLTINAPPGDLRIREIAQKTMQPITSNVTILRLKDKPAPSLQSLVPRVSLSAMGNQPAVKTAEFAPTPKVAPAKVAPAAKLTGPGAKEIVKIETPPPALALADKPAPPPARTPRLRLLPRERRFWTMQPIDAALPNLTTAWSLTATNYDAVATPRLQLRCNDKVVGNFGTVVRRMTLPVNGQMVKSAIGSKGAGGPVTCAAVLTSNGTSMAKSDEGRLVLRSLSSLSGQPVTLAMRSLKRGIVKNAWFADTGDISAEEANATLHLADGSMLGAVAPWLSGANGFSVKGGSASGSEAYRFVKDSRIIASLTFTDARLPAARQLAKDLGADLLYYGATDDMSLQTDATGRKAWLQAMASAKRSVYILDGEMFVEVDPQFLLDRTEAQQFVEGRSTMWFSKPVQVIR